MAVGAVEISIKRSCKDRLRRSQVLELQRRVQGTPYASHLQVPGLEPAYSFTLCACSNYLEQCWELVAWLQPYCTSLYGTYQHAPYAEQSRLSRMLAPAP